MRNLTGFLAFISSECLEEAAKENLIESRASGFPLFQKFVRLPEEELIKLYIKSLKEFSSSVADGTFMEKQMLTLKSWGEDNVERGVKKEDIHPSDFILMYSAQKKALSKFIPRYTNVASEIIEILNELELLYANLLDISISLLFKWRKEKEQNLKNINIFLDTVLENIPNMIFVKGADELRFVRLNKAGEELLGFTNEVLIGKNDFDFFPKEQAEFFTHKDKEVLAKKKLLDIPEEEINTLKKGSRWLHTKKIPVLDKDGKPVFLLGISEDITEKKIQEDLNIQLNRELEAFTYTVSHDLRAPLRAINGYANMFKEDYGNLVDDEGKRLLEMMRYNAEKMGCLIDDLLAFSKLGRKDLDRTFENMNELVEGVLLETNKNNPNKAQIQINNLLPTHVDYGLIHQVWLNLLSNAIKYSSKKETPKIEISCEKKNKEIIYSIKDNGVGFSMKYADKLFGVFQRLHRSDEFEGTGVGLAIVQRIVSKHHGRVWAEAKVDNGATFSFSLPCE